MSKHAVIRIKMSAVIGDFEFIDDVVQFASSFSLNAIPTASLLVAVGQNLKTEQLATIHEALNAEDGSSNIFTKQIPATVYMKTYVASEEDTDTQVARYSLEQFEDDSFRGFKVFEGDVVGVGFRRTTTGAHFTIHLLHWLGRLNYSSALSASSHPGNPGSFTYPAVFRALGGTSGTTGAGESLATWVPAVSSKIIDDAALEDLWGGVLHKWIELIASDDPLDLSIGGEGGGNPDIIDAISRIGPNEDGIPLQLDYEGDNAELLREGITQALTQETFGSWVNTTIWGKLVGEWAPAYWFSIAPRVEDALIVPFAGGLQVTPWKTITTDDYSYADMNAQMHQVLRGVGIAQPIGYATGVDMGLSTPAVDIGGLAGYFGPEDIDTGMILLKDAPRWLSDPIVPYLATADVEGNGASKTTQTGADETDTGDGVNSNIASIITDQQNLLSKYAQQWYILESLKGRIGELAGKIRFDIAPGSNVLIESGGARNVAVDKTVQENVYATVMTVSYIVNAEAQKAGTSFTLAHIRTEEENKSPATSIEKPALYADAWRGAFIVTPNRSS